MRWMLLGLSFSTCCFWRFCQLCCPPWGMAHPTPLRRLWWNCIEYIFIHSISRKSSPPESPFKNKMEGFLLLFLSLCGHSQKGIYNQLHSTIKSRQSHFLLTSCVLGTSDLLSICFTIPDDPTTCPHIISWTTQMIEAWSISHSPHRPLLLHKLC